MKNIMSILTISKYSTISAGTHCGGVGRRFVGPVRRLALWAALVAAISFAGPVVAAKPWQTLEGCTLVTGPGNDGDSFRVRWSNEEFIVRIYYADAPETRANFTDRVQAQADYFGIPVDRAIAAGKLAQAYVMDLLKDGFTIKTRWQGVYGGARAARRYGCVSVQGKDLADLLVANGLARIHGMGISGQTSEEVVRLRELEAQAKAEKRGAWGLR